MPTPASHGTSADTIISAIAAGTTEFFGAWSDEYWGHIAAAHATLATRAGTGTEYAAAEASIAAAATAATPPFPTGAAALRQARAAFLHAIRATP